MNESVLYIITYLLSQILGVYAAYKLITSFFQNRKIQKSLEIVAFIGYYFLTVMVYLLINIPIVNFAVNLFSFFILTLMYESSIKKKVLVSLFSYILMACAEMIVVVLTGYINFPIAEKNNYSSILGGVIANVLIYAVSMFINCFKNIKFGNTFPKAYWISLFIIPVLSLIMLSITFQSVGLDSYQIAASVTIVFVINFTIFFLFDRLSKLYQDSQKKEFVEKQNQYYEKQLQIINVSMKTMSTLKHDMQNHLNTILVCIEKENIDEAKNYITSMIGVSKSNEEMIQTGYPAIDSLVNVKFQLAKQNGIKVSSNVHLPPDLNFSAFDSTVILGNLLDNAIRAASDVTDNKYIEFAVRYSKGILFIKISNPYKNIIMKENKSMVTTKEDKVNHGFGLTSVGEVVEKYNGTVKIETDENIFTITVALYV